MPNAGLLDGLDADLSPPRLAYGRMTDPMQVRNVIPGVSSFGVTTLATSLNFGYYFPNVVTRPIVVDAMIIEKAGHNSREESFALVRADADWQPEGRALLQWTATISATGVYTVEFPPTLLLPGRYLQVWSTNSAGPSSITRVTVGSCIGFGASNSALGNNCVIQYLRSSIDAHSQILGGIVPKWDVGINSTLVYVSSFHLRVAEEPPDPTDFGMMDGLAPTAQIPDGPPSLTHDSHTYVGLPGRDLVQRGTDTQTNGRPCGYPILARNPWSFDRIVVEVTTLSSAADISVAVVPADSSWQPCGQPLAWATTNVAATGVVNFDVPRVYAPPGRYLALLLNANGPATVGYRGAIGPWPDEDGHQLRVVSTLGSFINITRLQTVSTSYTDLSVVPNFDAEGAGVVTPLWLRWWEQ